MVTLDPVAVRVFVIVSLLPAVTLQSSNRFVREEFEAFETTEIPPLGSSRWTLNPAPVAVACEIVTVELPELVRVSYCVFVLTT
jgi:hypothetical protein